MADHPMSNESEAVRPPDMVGAGMMPPSQPPADLMGALSMGNMPTGAMQQMMQPPQSGLGGAINAMGAGVFAGRGQQDPVAHQQMEQQRIQMEQQRQMMQMQERQQDRAMRRNQSLITVTSGLLEKTTEPGLKAALAKQLTGLYKQGGMDIPPAVQQAWTEAGPMTPENLKILAQKIASGVYSDQQLVQEAERQGLPPSQYAQTKKFLQSPQGKNAAGVPSDEALKMDHLKYEEAKGKAFDAVHKEVGRGTIEGDYASENYRQLRGKPIVEHDDQNPLDVQALSAAVAHGKMQAALDLKDKREWDEHMVKIKEEARERLAASKEAKGPLSGTWIDRQTGTLVTPTKGAFNLEPGRYRHLGASEEQMYTNTATALQMVHDTGTLLDKLTKRYGTEAIADSLKEQDSSLWGQAKQFLGGQTAKTIRNDPDWAQFFNLVTETNIELARVVGGSGQLRTTVLQKLTEANLKGWETADVGHRILGTVENSIWNRRQAIIGGGTTTEMRPYNTGSTAATTAPPPGFKKIFP